MAGKRGDQWIQRPTGWRDWPKAMRNDEWQLVYSRRFELANDLVYEAGVLSEHGEHDEAIALLEVILQEHPEHLGALANLGGILIRVELNEASQAVNQRALRIARDLMPLSFDVRHSLLGSVHLNNQAILRIHFNLGTLAWWQGDPERACWLFETVLGLDGADRLGARFMLIKLGFVLCSPRTVIRGCTQLYDLEGAAESQYCLALAHIQLGDHRKGAAVLDEAVGNYPKVGAELLAEKHRPIEPKDGWGFGVGSDGEAYDYWAAYGRYWLQTPKAMALLRLRMV